MALIDAGQLHFIAMEGIAKTTPFKIEVGQGIAGVVARSGKPLVIPDVRRDHRFFQSVDKQTGFETRSLVCIPVMGQRQVLGVIQALNPADEGAFDDDDMRLMMALGGLAGAALTRARRDTERRDQEAALKAESDCRYLMVQSRNSRMKEVMRIAGTAARSNSTVLLLGESGTGKEVIARSIHRQSERRERPFIAVNCVALTPTLLESELFGHERGAFTGATHQKKGKFELASGGTLFLDEIGELAPELQTKLLRVLQEREVERVGGTQILRIDVRVVAATNKDLQRAMAEREFREDLFYRLNVITIHILPLRERPEDIPGLCIHFLMRACQAVKRPAMRMSPAARLTLAAHSWPGNVRELANATERIAVLCECTTIDVQDLPSEISGDRRPLPTRRPNGQWPLAELVKNFKREVVERALDACDGNQTRAAQMLGVQQPNLSRMLRTLDLR